MKFVKIHINFPLRKEVYFIDVSTVQFFTFLVITINGSWCPWQAWGRCSQFCYKSSPEEQFRQRIRKCECPMPENGGQECGEWKNEHCYINIIMAVVSWKDRMMYV
jgi:hypothetical protein